MNIPTFFAIRHRLLLIVVFLCALSSQAQTQFTQSNLPIVIINTDIDDVTGLPAEIPDDPKVPASMKIIYHTDGSTNYLTDQDNTEFLDYNGRVKIEIRGSTSQALPKKQYGWTTYEDNTSTKKKVSIMGMPKENDWILNGLAYDGTLMRDYMTYNFSRLIGAYASRTQYCEVVINGVYKGLYVLQEKIKDDSNRVNVEKIDGNAASGIPLTGGYITKSDKIDNDDPLAWSMNCYTDLAANFIHVLPKPEDVTTAQQDYIQGEFLKLAETAQSGNADLATGYPSVIDMPSFIDFMIINELSSNVDAYQFSTYFHKDIAGKLRAGPVWDFNFSYGNDSALRSNTDIWQFDNGDNEGAKFWKDLYNNTTFRCYFSRRWNELTSEGQPLYYANITAFIDQTASLIADAAAREQQTWYTVSNWNGETEALKFWLLERMNWITTNLGDYNACENPVLPSLVISAINYHPITDAQFTDSEDLEFIKITNSSTESVDLTGIYLKELGVSFQFEAGSELNAGQSAYLANNAEVFRQKYGFAAFGEFQRNLSNSSQNIVLADGYGNIIDAVYYQDKSPWPDADGSGSYLLLSDITLDNSVAENWSLSTDVVEDTSGVSKVNKQIKVYPNPVGTVLNVKTDTMADAVTVYDLSGKVLFSGTFNDVQFSINFESFEAGFYIVKVTSGAETSTHKVLKK
jgi:spore coat protein CotH